MKISYDNNSSVFLNSLEDFLSYSEIKPLISVGIDISWVYLVKFQQKNVPEKQQIDMSFRTNNSSYRHFYESDIFLKISHTERTWGVDIESLLTGHIETLFISENKLNKFINDKSTEIGFIIGILFFLGAIIGTYYSTNNFISSNLEMVNSLDFNTSVVKSTVLEQKIDVLIDIVVTGKWNIFIYKIAGFLFISFIISIFLGSFASEKARNKSKSFILFTKETINLKKNYYKDEKSIFMNMVYFLILPILTGIIANIVFTKLYLGQ